MMIVAKIKLIVQPNEIAPTPKAQKPRKGLIVPNKVEIAVNNKESGPGQPMQGQLKAEAVEFVSIQLTELDKISQQFEKDMLRKVEEQKCLDQYTRQQLNIQKVVA